MSGFNIEYTVTLPLLNTIEALDSGEAEDLALEQLKELYPEAIGPIVVESVTEIETA